MNNHDQLFVHFKDDDLKTSVYLMFAGKKVRPDDVQHLDIESELRNYHPMWYNYAGFSRSFDIPSAHTIYFQWNIEEVGSADHDILQRMKLLGVPNSSEVKEFIEGPHNRLALFINTAEDRFRKRTFHITIAKNGLGESYDVLRVELDVPQAIDHPQYLNPDAAKAS